MSISLAADLTLDSGPFSDSLCRAVLREPDVAVFGGDCVDVVPGREPELPLPLHQLGVATIGLTSPSHRCRNRLPREPHRHALMGDPASPPLTKTGVSP